MNSVRKTLVLACAVSVLGLGAAFAQTDPNATPMAPAAGAAAAPSGDMGTDTAAMPKKKMMKKKHMSKKMMKKKTM